MIADEVLAENSLVATIAVVFQELLPGLLGLGGGELRSGRRNNRSCAFICWASVCVIALCVLHYYMVHVYGSSCECLAVPVSVLVREERAKSPIHSFWRLSLSIWTGDVDTSALWGRTLDGGTSVPSVSRSPGVSPQRRRGGPWAPPPRVAQIPGDVSGSFCLFFCCGLGSAIWFFVLCISSLGLVSCVGI